MHQKTGGKLLNTGLTILFAVLGLFILAIGILVPLKLRHLPNWGYRIVALAFLEMSCISAILSFNGFPPFVVPTFILLLLGLVVLFAVAIPNLKKQR
jgi:hypothetical protein